MIGLCSGKVVAYGMRTKRCPTCEAASKMNSKLRVHDCRLNWAGSSKQDVLNMIIWNNQNLLIIKEIISPVLCGTNRSFKRQLKKKHISLTTGV